MTANLEKIKFWVIKPKAMTNMITNPSIETNDTGYTVVGAGVTKARVATYQRRGAWSLEITPVDSVESGAYFGDVTVVNGTVYTVSVDVYAPDGVNFFLKVLNTSATSRGLTTFSGNDSWTRETLTFTAAADEDVRIYVTRMDSETGVLPFYIDGLQMEANSEATTYFDGDMVGFVPTRNDFGWNGTRHGSTSYRTAKTRAGGELVYLGVQGSDDYRVMQTSGLGMGSFVQTYTNIITGGMLYEKHSRTPRTFSLKLDFGHNDNIGEIMAKRAEIIDAIRPDFVDDQPMIVRMQGWDASMLNEAGEPVDVPCVPLTPLENIPDNPYLHQAIITFLATDALFPGAFNEGAQLDFSDSLTNANAILVRTKEGLWQELDTGIGYTIVYSVAIAPNGDVYAGGGSGTTYFLEKWDGTSWTSVATPTGTIFAMVFDNDGNLYIGGQFTNWGDANGDFIVMWDGASISSLGTGLNGSCYALEVDSDGNIILGGGFSLAGGVANTSRIAKWDGSVFTPLGTGVGNEVRAIAIDALGNIYAGGLFTAAGGSPANYIAMFDGSSWSPLGSGMSSYVYSLAIMQNGNLLAGGNFTTAGGNSIQRIAKWNGTSWSNLEGVTTVTGTGVYTIAINKSGEVYFAGAITFINGVAFYSGFIKWYDGNIEVPFVDLPSIGAPRDFVFDNSGNLYVGFDTAGTALTSGYTQVTNSSGANVYPIVEITGPGLLYGFTNLELDKQISFANLTLLTNEVLKINLEPDNITVESSFRGDCLNYVVEGSNLADFSLAPGVNTISIFMTGTDSDTDAVIYYSPRYWSLDQTKYGA